MANTLKNIFSRSAIAVLAMVLLAVALPSCKTKKAASTNPTANKGTKDEGPGKGKKKITEKERLDAEYLFYNASKESMLGNYDEAVRLYTQSLSINPNNAAAYYELGRIAFDKNDAESAITLGRMAMAIDKKNIWYKYLLAQALQASNKPDEAVKIFEQIAKDKPDSPEYAYELADAYLKASRPYDAIKALDKIENLLGVTPEVCEEKQRIYVRLGNIDKAAAEVQKIIDLNPKDPSYYLALADMYFINRMPEKAFDIYKKVLEIDPSNGAVHYSLSQYYRDKGEKEKSYNELKLAFGSPDVNIDTKMQVLMSYYNLSETNADLKKQAYELLDLTMQAHPEDAKGFSLYGDFLMRDKRYTGAKEAYLKVIDRDDSKFAVWQQLLVCDSELNDYQALYDHSSKALELFPTQPTLYLYKGISGLQLKKNKEAIEALTDGGALVYNNQQLELQFDIYLGDAYNEQKEYTRSDEFYEKALGLEPQNTYVLNNYSYYLSLRKEKLPKAREMARLVNTLEPNNASYEDTYGWILFCLGEYKEAQQWLDKSLSHGGENDGTVLEHYGDVLFKLNFADKALDYWKKAKEKGGTSNAIDRKISEKRLVE